MGTPQRRKIRNYLIDRKVQLSVTLVMLALSSLLTAVLGFFWYAEIRNASDVIRINAISLLGTAGADRLGQELAAADHRRLLILIGFAVVLGLLIAAYGIVMTHRIAGPLFKINRHMNDIAEGRLQKVWGLRKGDQLQAFFGTFERMNNALREGVEADVKLLNEVIAAVESEGDLPGLIPELQAVVARKTESLRDAASR
jgi:methyl-accepting chemotaxis protein